MRRLGISIYPEKDSVENIIEYIKILMSFISE